MPRIVRIVALAVLLIVFATAMAMINGPLSEIRPGPAIIAGISFLGLATLLFALFDAKRRVQDLDQRSGELARVKLELETTVRALQQRHRE